LDKRTRGNIEKTLDKTIANTPIIETVGWILEGYLMKSVEEIALGYMLGALKNYVHLALSLEKITKGRRHKDVTEEDEIEIKDMLTRRIPDIMDKINRELNR